MKYCPYDATLLVEKDFEGKKHMACPKPKCEFVNWNGPLHVVAVIIPHQDGLAMVKRGVKPIGKWCFPCGFIDEHESAYNAAIRETYEESGLVTVPNKLVGTFCPTPAKNQNINVYVSRVVGGVMVAGSDSTDVGVFNKERRPDSFAFEFHERLYDAYFDGRIKLDDEGSVLISI
ncbi:MAG: NUDIX domain-containing protein [Candidatus Vogelbacteria bacterium]|nr:NUDIX domain-containing protein [Candidatus Vogelbacteria bacterium]